MLTPTSLPAPAASATAAPPPPAPPSAAATEGTFHLCSGSDLSSTARAIEQLVDGRGFSARLMARGDGCADLTIQVTSPASSGSASSRLSVSVGNGQTLTIQIVSDRGATRVDIGQNG